MPRDNRKIAFSEKVLYLIPFLLSFAMLFIFGRPSTNPDANAWYTFLGIIAFFSCVGLALMNKSLGIAKFTTRLLGIAIIANLLLATNHNAMATLQNSNIAYFGILVLMGTVAMILYWSHNHLEPIQDLKSNWFVPIVLIGIFSISLFLRYKNINLLDSNRDEEHHMIAAKSLLTNGYFQYERGAIVSLMTALFAKVSNATTFQGYLEAGRMGMPFVGSITIFPIYFIGKFINKRTGLIAAFLFATSPWLIGMSKVIREHTIYILLASFFVLLVINLFKRILNQKSSILDLAPTSIAIIGILFYSFSFDWLSTAKITGVFFVCLNASLVVVYFSRIREIVLKHQILILPIVVVLVLTIFFLSRIKFLETFQFRDARWSNSFLLPSSTSPVHWWTKAIAFKYTPYFFLFCGMLLSIVKKQKMYFVYLLSFCLMLFGYQYFLARYFAPKYIIYLMPLFVVCIAYGVEAVIQLIVASFNLPRNHTVYAGLLGLCMFVFNPAKVYNTVIRPPMIEASNLVTGLIHLEKDVAHEFLASIPKEELSEIGFISSVYENVIYMDYDWECVHHYKYKSLDKETFVEEKSKEYPKGYMLLDSYRNGTWKAGIAAKVDDLPFLIGDATFKLIKNEQNCMIYEWGDHIRSPDDLYEKIGSDYRVETSTVLDMGYPMSLSFWIYGDAVEMIADPFNILSVGEDSASGFVLNFPQTDSLGTFLDYGFVQKNGGLRTPLVRDGKWHHMVVYQSGGLKGSLFGCYVDGKRGTSSRIPIHKHGKKRVIINYEFVGDIREVEAYDKMLTESEAAVIYEEGKKRFSKVEKDK